MTSASWSLAVATAVFGCLALCHHAEASVTLLIAGHSSNNVYKRALARRVIQHFDSLYNDSDVVAAFSLFVENDDALGSLNELLQGSQLDSKNTGRLNTDGGLVAIHRVRHLNASSVAFLRYGLDEMSLQDVRTLNNIIQNTDGIVFVEIGIPAVQTLSFLQKTAFCWGETALDIESPNRAFLCNQLDVSNTPFLHQLGLRPVEGHSKIIKRREVIEDFEQEISIFPTIFVSAEKSSKKSKKHEKPTAAPKVEEDDDEDNENEKPSKEDRSKKLGCKYRKTCYETGKKPKVENWIPSLPTFSVPDVSNYFKGDEKKKAGDDQAEDEGVEKDERAEILEKKLKCKYKPSCYKEQGIKLDKRTEEMEEKARLLSTKKQVDKTKPKRTLKDIATSTLKKVEQEKEKRAVQPPPTSLIVEKKLNEIEEKLQKKLNCKYRKSCYDTGVKPEIEQSEWLNMLTFSGTKAAVREDERIFEELEDEEKKLYCKYRKACYETGKKPDLTQQAKFKIVEIAKTDEREIPLAEKCKYRKSCYETGIVPDLRKSNEVQKAVEKAEKTNIPTNIATLKLFCKYRRSCYEELAESDSATEEFREIAKKRAETKAKAKEKKHEPKVIKKEGKQALYRMGRQRGREARLVRAGIREPKNKENVKVEVEDEDEDELPVADADADDQEDEDEQEEEEVQKKLDHTKTESKVKKGRQPERRPKPEDSDDEEDEEEEDEGDDEHKPKNAKRPPPAKKTGRLGRKIIDEAAEAITEETLKAEGRKEPPSSKKEKIKEKEEDRKKEKVKVEERREDETKHKKPEEKKPEKRTAKKVKQVIDENADDEEILVNVPKEETPKTKKVETKARPAPIKKHGHVLPPEQREGVNCKYRKSCYDSGIVPELEGYSHIFGDFSNEDEEDAEEEMVDEQKRTGLPCKYRKSCYESGVKPKITSSTFGRFGFSISSTPDEPKIVEAEDRQGLACKYRKSCYESGVIPDLSEKAQKKTVTHEESGEEEEEEDESIGEKKGLALKLACKYRRSCYETGERPVIDQSLASLYAGLAAHVDATQERKVSPNHGGAEVVFRNEEDKKLDCKYRKSCYETGRLPALVKEAATVIEATRGHKGISREMRCKYRKSCYEALDAAAVGSTVESKPEKVERVEKISKQAEKPHVKPPKEEKKSRPETPKPAKTGEEKQEKSEKDKKSEKKKKTTEKPKKEVEEEKEEQHERVIQREEVENAKERAANLSVSQKLRCKYRHSCYVNAPPASLSEDHAATMARSVNGTTVRTKCHKYYLSCREVLGLPPKEKAPIGPNGRRLCRKKPKPQ